MANGPAEERQSVPGGGIVRNSFCPFCGSGATNKFLRGPDRFHLRQEIYQLMRCSDCGGVWLAEPPSPEQMGIHYSEDYHRAIAIAGEYPKRWQKHRELIQRYKRGGAILDIGCSSGGFLTAIKSDAWKLYGIEMEQSTAEKARAATGAEVFVGDAMDAPFAPNSFDAITTFDVLEHVYRPRAFLAKVLEWLKPGGMYFVLVPNIGSWEAKAFGSYWYGLELPRHISHFSPSSLRFVARSVGFEAVELRTPPITYLERSAGYLWAAGMETLGMKATPQSQPRRVGVPERAVRKAIWMGLVSPYAALASKAGAAGSIEGVFAKPATSN